MARTARNVGWIVLGLLTAGCGHEQVVPASPNPFVDDVRFETLPEREDIGYRFGWTVGEGRLAELSFAPRSDHPREYQGRAVRAPEDWPTTLVLFRHGRKWSDEETIWLGLTRYSLGNIGRPQKVLPLRHNRVGWDHAGFPGDPIRPKYAAENPDRIYCWTFLALKPELTGEFVYEVLLFPTCTGSVVYHDLGPPVVLKRGLVTIAPRQE